MKKTNITKIKWQERKSPKGRFHAVYKDISAAIGDVRNGWPKEGHPFNLALVKLPPGKSVCPHHQHTTQWEMFVILSGTGVVRADMERHKVKAGDALMHPPGEAHQIINTGRKPLVFYIIADNPPVDIFYYPDSDKWGMRPNGKYFRLTEAEYCDGEE